MHRRFSRWVSFLAIGAGSALLISCGGNGGNTGGKQFDASVDAPNFGNLNGDGGAKCKPKTCADYSSDTCGQQADGCGNLTEKCNANDAARGFCQDGEYCGGGGYSKCGGKVGYGAEGGSLCTKKTCNDFPTGTCGVQTDGCQGLTDKCNANDAGGPNGLCSSGQFCGGGGSGICGTGLDAGADGGPINNCVPKTCADLDPRTCGQQSDGCGGLTPDCNPTCPTGQFCGGAGPGLCGTGTADGGPQSNPCVPLTCANLGNPCGPQADGCGGTTVACTTCPSGTWCGGGGPNQCGNGFQSTDPAEATPASCRPAFPKTCSNFPTGTCGQQSDGCGGLTASCNPCATGQFCGGGGAGQCGNGLSSDAGVCNPLTCSSFPSGTCGQQSDGCGGLTANCGGCTGANQYCGGGGPGICGTGPLADAGACTPWTCSHYTGTCGQHSDGCGGLTANCGSCPLNQFCGGGGTGICGGGAAIDGGSCTPWTCSHYPSGTCGQQSDGCGGLTANCGGCTNPQFCGGDVTKPGMCGGNNGLAADGGSATQCKPATCASKGYNCGQASDGCGGTIGPCGTCSAPDACGAGGHGQHLRQQRGVHRALPAAEAVRRGERDAQRNGHRRYAIDVRQPRPGPERPRLHPEQHHRAELRRAALRRQRPTRRRPCSAAPAAPTSRATRSWRRPRSSTAPSPSTTCPSAPPSRSSSSSVGGAASSRSALRAARTSSTRRGCPPATSACRATPRKATSR